VTMVDMFSIPMSLTLNGQRRQTTGTLVTNGRDNIFAAISASPEFKSLVVGGLRVIAPGHGIDAGLFSATYFDPYVSEVWNRYSSTDLRVQATSGTYTGRVSGGQLVFNNGVRAFTRPSTRDIFYCDGALNAGATRTNDPSPPVAAILGAAFNRTTARDFPSQPTTDPNTFYRTPISNHYSRVIHENTQDHKAYGFAFDDVVSLASYVEDHAPTSLTLRLTPFGSQDPGSGNPGGNHGNQLQAGQRLLRGQELVSTNGRFHLVLQTDGNLVLYDGAPGQNPIWATGTWNLPTERRPTHADMQTDGNLVLYNDANQPAWAAGVFGTFTNPYLEVQDDGNLVIYHNGRTAIWASNTARP
jgi:Beta-1,3-glucanase